MSVQKRPFFGVKSTILGVKIFSCKKKLVQGSKNSGVKRKILV